MGLFVGRQYLGGMLKVAFRQPFISTAIKSNKRHQKFQPFSPADHTVVQDSRYLIFLQTIHINRIWWGNHLALVPFQLRYIHHGMDTMESRW